jgi:phosphocarrier protein FPr/phosphocarrier protein
VRGLPNARGFAAKVTVEKSGATAAITSPSAMLRLGVGHGDAIHLVAQGDEAGEALDAICALIESGMGEFLALSQDVVIEAPVFAVQAPQAGDRITGVTAAPAWPWAPHGARVAPNRNWLPSHKGRWRKNRCSMTH